MTDAERTEPEPEDVPSDELVAIAVDATDLRPAALRGIAEMLEMDADQRARLAKSYREQAQHDEECVARDQRVLDAFFALPGGEWVRLDALSEQLGMVMFDVRAAISSLGSRGWPIYTKWAPGEPEVFRLLTPSAQARLVGGAADGRE